MTRLWSSHYSDQFFKLTSLYAICWDFFARSMFLFTQNHNLFQWNVQTRYCRVTGVTEGVFFFCIGQTNQFWWLFLYTGQTIDKYLLCTRQSFLCTCQIIDRTSCALVKLLKDLLVLWSKYWQIFLRNIQHIDKSSSALVKLLKDLPVLWSKYWHMFLRYSQSIDRSSWALVKLLKALPSRWSKRWQIFLRNSQSIDRSSCALVKELTDLPAQKSKYWWIVLCIGLTIKRSSCALVKVLKDLPRNGHTIDRSYCALVKLITVTWELSNFSPIITNFFCYDQAFDKKFPNCIIQSTEYTLDINQLVVKCWILDVN